MSDGEKKSDTAYSYDEKARMLAQLRHLPIPGFEFQLTPEGVWVHVKAPDGSGALIALSQLTTCPIVAKAVRIATENALGTFMAIGEMEGVMQTLTDKPDNFQPSSNSPLKYRP
jgi:hypothetical protein